jgi:hypothetical protein
MGAANARIRATCLGFRESGRCLDAVWPSGLSPADPSPRSFTLCEDCQDGLIAWRRMTRSIVKPAGTLGRAMLLALAAVSAGCAPLATVTYCKPAAIDVAGMKRLAVMDFHGEGGDAVASALSGRLWNNRFYTVVSESELLPIKHASYCTEASEECLLKHAREAGIDAVVVGSVLEYRCDDEVAHHADPLFPRDEEKPGDYERDLPRVGLASRDRVRRDAVVRISFRLLDARTGEVRAAKESTQHSESEPAPAGTDLPPRSEVLAGLVDQCVDEFVEMLAPHEDTCQMRLSRGEWPRRGAVEVRSGNQAAIAGDWEAARTHWRAALDLNPACDAALYNLAIEAAQRQAYSEAEDFAMQALRVEHCDLYTDGLAQIRKHRSNFESTREQQGDRILQASLANWR